MWKNYTFCRRAISNTSKCASRSLKVTYNLIAIRPLPPPPSHRPHTVSTVQKVSQKYTIQIENSILWVLCSYKNHPFGRNYLGKVDTSTRKILDSPFVSDLIETFIRTKNTWNSIFLGVFFTFGNVEGGREGRGFKSQTRFRSIFESFK